MAQNTILTITTSEMESSAECHNEELFSRAERFPLVIREEDIERGETILAEACAALEKGKVICAYHNDPKCWGNCTDLWNPFNKIEFQLKRIECQIPRNSYWNDEVFVKMLSIWAYHLHHTYFRSSSCETLLAIFANKVFEDLKDAANGGSGNLQESFSHFLCNFHAEDGVLKQVAIGLGKLGGHLSYLQKEEAEEKRKQAELLHEKIAKEKQKCHDETLPKSQNMQDIDEAVPTTLQATGRASTRKPTPKESKARAKPAAKRKRGTAMSQSIQDNGEGSSTSAPGYDMASEFRSENEASRPMRKRNKTEKARSSIMSQHTQDNGEGPSSDVPKVSYPLTPASPPSPPLQYVQPTYAELANKDSPSWAEKYEKGSLGKIGLEVGKFDIEVKTPEMSEWTFEPPPIKKNKSTGPSFEWLAYAILLRVPGHEQNKDLKKCFRSSIQTLSRSVKLIQVCEKGLAAKDGGWWRIKDAKEVQIKASGGRKHQVKPIASDDGEGATNNEPVSSEPSPNTPEHPPGKRSMGENLDEVGLCTPPSLGEDNIPQREGHSQGMLRPNSVQRLIGDHKKTSVRYSDPLHDPDVSRSSVPTSAGQSKVS
ncbi:uncharacterized protein PAC_08271 [Phialocephala subalpina]|uniref:Uncharacterized protein n=1 Tax=Phialocephala subalpina TaxID=576137 RepID=A0A1L7X030_9HELO|nr:uncharacterized protein PAC_08271 [Phialocephala subalpina]